MTRRCGAFFFGAYACNFAFLAGAGQAAEPASGRPSGQKWAVLVGVDDYSLAEKLQYCGADQRALRDRLVAAGFPEKQVFLLDDEAKESRFRPSRGNIERQVDAVLKLAAEDDLVVLGFSGHGTQIGKAMYLVPGDGDPDDPATLVSLDGIYERLQACAAATKLVIVDACRNDPARGGRRTAAVADGARALSRSLKEARLPTGTVLFNSCAPGEISWEEEKFRHGVFMHYVLEGLGGRADGDGDGRLSLNELAKYATHETKTFVLNEKNVTQYPYLRSEGEADLLDHPLLAVAKGAMFTSLEPRPAAGGGPAKSGEVTTNSLGMKLVRIPAGEFDMGSNETNGQLESAGFPVSDGFDSTDERPVHRVRITKPFLMGAHEVTLGHFLHFYHDGYRGRLDCERDGKGWPGFTGIRFAKSSGYRPWNWGHPSQTNDHHVVLVGWRDCVAFCEWLSVKEKRRYRLPTEAEWEYACRAGTTTRFWFGDDPNAATSFGNVADETAKGRFPWWDNTLRSRDGYAFTAPVGAFGRPNPFGLHDMHGNVWEWCSDFYDKNYYAAFAGQVAIDPTGPATGSSRVTRGGSWNSGTIGRSALRGACTPALDEDDYPFVGFRVVCEIE